MREDKPHCRAVANNCLACDPKEKLDITFARVGSKCGIKEREKYILYSQPIEIGPWPTYGSQPSVCETERFHSSVHLLDPQRGLSDMRKTTTVTRSLTLCLYNFLKLYKQHKCRYISIRNSNHIPCPLHSITSLNYPFKGLCCPFRDITRLLLAPCGKPEGLWTNQLRHRRA